MLSGIPLTACFPIQNLLSYPPRDTVKRLGKGKSQTPMKDKLPEIFERKTEALLASNRLAGQLPVEHSVTDGDECADILMLLAAIRGGVNSLMAENLEDTFGCTLRIRTAGRNRTKN